MEDNEKRCPFVENNVLVVVRNLKKFRYMLSTKKINFLVAHPSVKEFLLNKDINDKRFGWIKKVMEYDVEIRVTKLIRGKGLCEHLAGDLENNKEVENQTILVLNDEEKIVVAGPPSSWIQEMVHYLYTGECPKGPKNEKQRYFKLQSIPYVIINGILFRKYFHGVLLRCVESYQMIRFLKNFMMDHLVVIFHLGQLLRL